MIFSAHRLAAVAVTTKVGDYQRVVLCKLGGDFAPLYMRLRIPVQKQNGRPVASNQNIDGRAVGLDGLTPETWEKVHGDSSFTVWRAPARARRIAFLEFSGPCQR